MLQIFYGDDRVRTQKDVKTILGDDYELFEGENLILEDMDSIFFGTTLFADKRKILIKDLSKNSDCFGQLINYVDTPHEIIVWERKLDGRSAFTKELKKKIRCIEYKAAPVRDRNFAFSIFDQAWNGKKERALEMCEEIKYEEEAYQIMGAMIWKAIDKLNRGGGAKAKKTLKLFAKADMDMKYSNLDAWKILEAALIQI